MLAVKNSVQRKKQEKKILFEWLSIQQNSIDSALHFLTLCQQYANKEVSDIPINVAEKSIVILCKKIHTIQQYQRCIRASYESSSKSVTSDVKHEYENIKADIDCLRSDLYHLIFVMQKKLNEIKQQRYFTALFRNQLAAEKNQN